MNIQQCLEENIDALNNSIFGQSGGSCFECCEYELMYSDLEDRIKKYQLNLLKVIRDDVGKIKKRYRCAACDGAKCGHTLGCKEISEVLNLLDIK